MAFLSTSGVAKDPQYRFVVHVFVGGRGGKENIIEYFKIFVGKTEPKSI